jgi:hypothetical protein
VLKLTYKEAGKFGYLRRYHHPRIGEVQVITTWRFGGTILVVEHKHGLNLPAALARGQLREQEWPTPIDQPKPTRKRRKAPAEPAKRRQA